VHSHAPSGTGSSPPASGWTDTELSVRLRRGAGGAIRVDGVLCSAPVWFRWDGAVLWLVGSGASPVGEDHVRVTVDVGPGVEVSVRSVAATVAYAARGDGTRWDTELRVAEGARVDWRPEPLILTGRAVHANTTTVHAAVGADVVVDEVLVLGRAGEATGTVRSTLDVRVGAEPVLLTSIDTSVPGWDGPAGVLGARAIGSRLVVGRGPSALPPSTEPWRGDASGSPGPLGTVLDAGDGCRLAVAATADAPAARDALDALAPEAATRT
jgi:urease accessory protein